MKTKIYNIEDYSPLQLFSIFIKSYRKHYPFLYDGLILFSKQEKRIIKWYGYGYNITGKLIVFSNLSSFMEFLGRNSFKYPSTLFKIGY